MSGHANVVLVFPEQCPCLNSTILTISAGYIMHCILYTLCILCIKYPDYES